MHMNDPTVVSIHPYFRITPGQESVFLALLRKLVVRAATEEGCLYYEFTRNGDEVFCREAYKSAECLLFHVANVRQLSTELGQYSVLKRIEIHASADEIEKLKPTLADINVSWFVYECGFRRPAG